MNAIADKRCHNHANREAVALCPRCRNFYCRECVTEHEGRVLCAACLGEIAQGTTVAGRRVALLRPLAAILSFALVWLCFMVFGRILLELPDSFHENGVWTMGDSEADR